MVQPCVFAGKIPPILKNRGNANALLFPSTPAPSLLFSAQNTRYPPSKIGSIRFSIYALMLLSVQYFLFLPTFLCMSGRRLRPFKIGDGLSLAFVQIALHFSTQGIAAPIVLDGFLEVKNGFRYCFTFVQNDLMMAPRDCHKERKLLVIKLLQLCRKLWHNCSIVLSCNLLDNFHLLPIK